MTQRTVSSAIETGRVYESCRCR